VAASHSKKPSASDDAEARNDLRDRTLELNEERNRLVNEARAQAEREYAIQQRADAVEALYKQALVAIGKFSAPRYVNIITCHIAEEANRVKARQDGQQATQAAPIITQPG
jgi:single-stranded DNA-specific DHH superfamily exonuclease